MAGQWAGLTRSGSLSALAVTTWWQYATDHGLHQETLKAARWLKRFVSVIVIPSVGFDMVTTSRFCPFRFD
jgi:hypothetical protein